jgi:hypothetical protein
MGELGKIFFEFYLKQKRRQLKVNNEDGSSSLQSLYLK